MKNPLNSRKIKPPSEINWKIREFFFKTALTGFSKKIDKRYFDIEKSF